MSTFLKMTSIKLILTNTFIFSFLFVIIPIHYFSVFDCFIDKHPPWNLWNVVLFFVIYYIAVNSLYLHVSPDLPEPVLCYVPVHLHLMKTSS